MLIIEQARVLDRAMNWWESKRPEDWTYAQHCQRPDINCAGAVESGLANAVAAYIMAIENQARAKNKRGKP